LLWRPVVEPVQSSDACRSQVAVLVCRHQPVRSTMSFRPSPSMSPTPSPCTYGVLKSPGVTAVKVHAAVALAPGCA
jgi:hypothetical protein